MYGSKVVDACGRSHGAKKRSYLPTCITGNTSYDEADARWTAGARTRILKPLERSSRKPSSLPAASVVIVLTTWSALFRKFNNDAGKVTLPEVKVV